MAKLFKPKHKYSVALLVLALPLLLGFQNCGNVSYVPPTGLNESESLNPDENEVEPPPSSPNLPQATPTPRPGGTPLPTPVPTPGATPVPTPIPTPVPTPVPTPFPTPTPTPPPVFTPVTTPYHSEPFSIPGVIPAEDYDLGGPGKAYFDTTDGVEESYSYRRGDVDVVRCFNHGESCGYSVGYIDNGEWLVYTVNVAESRSYNLTVRLASIRTSRIHVYVDGVKTTTVSVPDLDVWDNFENVTSTILLPAGRRVLRFEFEGSEFDIDYFSLR